MTDFYEMLQKIRKRYPLYVGGKSIYQLKAFLEGYIYARMELGIEMTDREKDFENFHGWLEQRLRVETNSSWAKILILRSNDEIDASELFFELLDEFINREQLEKEEKALKQEVKRKREKTMNKKNSNNNSQIDTDKN